MTRNLFARIVATLAALIVCNAHARGNDESAEVIIEWNQLLQEHTPPTAGLSAPRYYAMLHIAMFDAANAIAHQYTPYRVRLRAASDASQVAAAAQAGHDILVAMNPDRQSVFDAALAEQLADIPTGLARNGTRIGKFVAARILRWRENDGWAAPSPPYELPLLPGLWQPTPPAFVPAAFTQIPAVKPFALLTTTQYLPSPPPTLTSEQYTADFIEVKELGSATSTTRTEEQTLVARLFALLGYNLSPFALWSNIARDATRANNLSLVDAARLFAFVAVSLHDGLLTSHTSKFVYGLWRPVTAIQRADEDLNPLTDADETWLPLIPTPPYPAYAGNMSCIAASAARAMENTLGTDDAAISVTWPGIAPNQNVTRNYSSFSQLAEEEARSRVYAGIHFEFDTQASVATCPKVADFVFARFMRPNDKGR
jgi:hypothetical protein